MTSRRMVLGAGAALALSGCYGKFSLVRKLYEWNGSFDNKYLVSILMWAMMIIPVYGIASFADFVVLNLIEFWTGTNPVASIEHEDGSRSRVQRLADGSLRVTRSVGGQELPAFELSRGPGARFVVRAADGSAWSSAEGLPDGSVELASSAGAQRVTPDEVRAVERSTDRRAAVARVLRPSLQGSLLARRS